MENQANDQKRQRHDREHDPKKQPTPPPEEQQEKQHQLQELLEQEEEEKKQEQDQERQNGQENHSISNAPFTVQSSSPPTKPPPPKPPSSRLDRDSPTQLKQFKCQTSPPDQTCHSYVFSSSSDVKLANPPSLSSPPSEAAPIPVTIVGSETQVEEAAKRPVEDGIGGKRKPSFSISVRKRDSMRRVLLGFRFFGLVFCLVSFSIMAADKDQGWALDSFYRYKEFRYCMSVNVIAFVYSGLQACDLAFSLATGKHVGRNQIRYLLDFSLDQVLTYLLLSASTSATFRVEDWESNWGKDKFPATARSSVVLSFLAFVAFALCSLVSGHTILTSKSM